MIVAILSARSGWHTDELCRALAERGHVGHVLPYEGLVARLGGQARTASLEADAVLARIIPNGSLEQIIYRVDTLHWLERRGIPVVNSPRAIEQCVDKFLTTALLQEAGLPVPETVVCEGVADAVAAVRAMGDAVIKPLFGSMGLGMVRVTDPDLAFRVARALEQTRAVFYVQRTIDHGGSDIRAFVVGDRVVGAIERRAPRGEEAAGAAGEWRTNISRGGTAQGIDLPEEWAALARRAAAVVGADYAGVDLLPARDGSAYVLEVNGIPGWQGLQQATGIDIAAAIAAQLDARMRVAATVTAHGGC